MFRSSVFANDVSCSARHKTSFTPTIHPGVNDTFARQWPILHFADTEPPSKKRQAEGAGGRAHPRARAGGGARRRQVFAQQGRRKRWEGPECSRVQTRRTKFRRPLQPESEAKAPGGEQPAQGGGERSSAGPFSLKAQRRRILRKPRSAAAYKDYFRKTKKTAATMQRKATK